MGPISTGASSFNGRSWLNNKLLGFNAEDKAQDYLETQGLKCVMRNYNCRQGEVDIIMRDKEYLVFVEVRSRSSYAYGGGVESITYAKKQKILRASNHYLLKHNLYDKYPLRFDVVSLDGKTESITWLKDAFGADY